MDCTGFIIEQSRNLYIVTILITLMQTMGSNKFFFYYTHLICVLFLFIIVTFFYLLFKIIQIIIEVGDAKKLK